MNLHCHPFLNQQCHVPFNELKQALKLFECEVTLNQKKKKPRLHVKSFSSYSSVVLQPPPCMKILFKDKDIFTIYKWLQDTTQFRDYKIKQTEVHSDNMEPQQCGILKWKFRMSYGEVVGVCLMLVWIWQNWRFSTFHLESIITTKLEGPLFHKHSHHKVEVIVIIEGRGPRNIQLVILIYLLQFNLVLSGSFCII